MKQPVDISGLAGGRAEIKNASPFGFKDVYRTDSTACEIPLRRPADSPVYTSTELCLYAPNMTNNRVHYVRLLITLHSLNHAT